MQLPNTTVIECELGTLCADVTGACDEAVEISITLEFPDGRHMLLAEVSVDRVIPNTGFVYAYDGINEYEAHVQRIHINPDDSFCY